MPLTGERGSRMMAVHGVDILTLTNAALQSLNGPGGFVWLLCGYRLSCMSASR